VSEGFIASTPLGYRALDGLADARMELLRAEIAQCRARLHEKGFSLAEIRAAMHAS
jgi:hypothetical protein